MLIGFPQPPSSAVPTYERPTSGPGPVVARLLKLDSFIRAGVPEAEFYSLFAKCRCGLVMTRRVFGNHVCAVATAIVPPTVIDLTLDSEDDGDNIGLSQHNAIVDLTVDSDDE